MGRGRPRIYKTAEDKAKANRAKSLRSYYKRKAALAPSHQNSNARYRAEISKTSVLPGATVDKKKTSGDPTNIKGWVSLGADMAERFDSFIKATPRRYFDLLYKQYTNNY
ncbi:hypothetical protein PC9H_009973 [Pleurotus ostreatus]|uniref:Uncharacterized protein n=1 Tax=Pleurotus ostreatus TaxID=5322 RepID=A0A8H7DR55_PLEOS|nr:uncharacterized protein PC9H_009973 [Pleurotus ostreatus]KAF7424663.1 hypothetical protein PC9H_009973 [Pleurotus ostreatus]KAJ8692356.1 hypothetical protein PTI98_009676 [Pleurotus ostreatus]